MIALLGITIQAFNTKEKQILLLQWQDQNSLSLDLYPLKKEFNLTQNVALAT